MRSQRICRVDPRRQRAPWRYSTLARHGAKRGFTLIEAIGILAVIAILAFLLIPRIYEAINNARLNHTCVNIQTIKTATVEHYAKFGSLASIKGNTLSFTGSYTNFDSVLLAENLIDKRFTSRLGTNAFIRLVRVEGFTESTEVNGSNGAYNLDGNGGNDVVGSACTVEAVFLNVPESDAHALNAIIDGANLAENPGQNDFRGRVIYHRPTPSKPQLRVSVYIAHK